MIDSAVDVIEAVGEHRATLVFFHGIGDTGAQWATALGVEMSKIAGLKVVCPTAGERSVALNGGRLMRSWFDAGGERGRLDEATIRSLDGAAETVREWIDDELRRSAIASDRVFVGGFSQGSVLALYSALLMELKLAGVIALSTYFPVADRVTALRRSANATTPVLQTHGCRDRVIPLDWATNSARALAAIFPNHSFKTYANLAHAICEQELVDVREFIEQCLRDSRSVSATTSDEVKSRL